MTTIPVFISIHTHQHGTDISVDTSMDNATKRQAKIARNWWEDRADKSAPDNHSDLSDIDVIKYYFYDNEKEFYDIETTTLDIEI